MERCVAQTKGLLANSEKLLDAFRRIDEAEKQGLPGFGDGGLTIPIIGDAVSNVMHYAWGQRCLSCLLVVVAADGNIPSEDLPTDLKPHGG